MSSKLRSAPQPELIEWERSLVTRFPDLPSRKLGKLVESGRSRALQRGEALLRAGELWEHAFWVQTGALRLYYVDVDGAEANKNFYLEEAFLWPLTPALREKRVSFHIEALEPCIVWHLPLTLLEEATDGLPSWVSMKLFVTSALLEEKMQREQVFLQCSARQRYELLLEEKPQWAHRIALRHLASYLGMTDVSLSRLRAEIGLIKG